MMGNLFFWKQWNKSDRTTYTIFLAVFGLSIIFYLFSYHLGADAIIKWVVSSKNQTVSLLKEGTNIGPVTLNYLTDNYLIKESFEGSDIGINYTASYIFLAFVAISLVLYLTVITTLTRFWFIVGVVIFTACIINFKLDQLLLFGSYKNLPLYGVLAIYLPLLYYFHAFARNTSFFLRWLIIGLVTVISGLILTQFSTVSNPVLYLVNYGILFPVIISILFVFSVAIEVIVGFLYIITRGNTTQSKNSLLHFSVVTLVYLVNVALVFAKNRQFIDWDFYYIDEFYLLLFSAIIGVWGFRHRSTLFENILPFRCNGGLLYLVAAVICMATIGYLFATGNDPLIETMEDTIVFSHLSFGFFFYLYVISNFIGPLHSNLQVYRVLYQPKHMPYYVMRFIGLVGVGGLFFQSGQLAMSQAIAGYYNGIGDLYMAVEDNFVAEQYYKLGSQFEFQNHRSNYGLASLANKQEDRGSALYYYQQSILKKPTPYAYANLANVYQSSGLFFDALFSLKEGVEHFPDNPYLYNNLGLLYAKTDIVDSAYLFLKQATLKKNARDVASANILSLLAEKKLKLDTDSLNNEYNTIDYLPVKNNLLVINNIHQAYESRLFSKAFLKDSILNPNTFAYLFNAGYNQSFVKDSAITGLIDRYRAVSQYSNYNQQLTLSKALNSYSHGEIIKAFKIMDQLQLENSGQKGYLNNINGLWALAEHSPALALDFFEKAIEAGYTDAMLNKGFALIEMDDLEQAKLLLANLQTAGTAEQNQMVPTLLKLLNSDSLQSDDLSDQEKYWLLSIYKFRNSDEENQQMLEEIENPYYQLAAKIGLMEHQFRQGKTDELSDEIGVLDQQEINDEKLAARFLHLKLTWLADQRDLKNIEKDLDRLGPEDDLLKSYLQAKTADAENNTEKALAAYQHIADKNPFEESYIVEAAGFFQEKIKDENLAYETILNAAIINPYSAVLSKAFILQCLKMGLASYAEEELQHLQTIITPGQYQDFLSLYQQVEEENEPNESW